MLFYIITVQNKFDFIFLTSHSSLVYYLFLILLLLFDLWQMFKCPYFASGKI